MKRHGAWGIGWNFELRITPINFAPQHLLRAGCGCASLCWFYLGRVGSFRRQRLATYAASEIPQPSSHVFAEFSA
jgi:hypothetical protein